MRRKKKIMITKKNPVYAPFDHKSGLELYDSDSICASCDEQENIDNLDYYALCELRDELVESISDIDTIIEIELEGSGIGRDLESLRSDRKRRQQLICELREVRKRIKMHDKSIKEVDAA